MNSEKGKIIFIAGLYPPETAPTGKFLNEIVSHIKNKNFNSLILTASIRNKNLRRNKDKNLVEVYVPSFKSQRIIGKFVRGLYFIVGVIIQLVRYKKKYDLLVFTTEPPFLILIAPVIKLILNKPYILLIWDMYPEIIYKLKFLNEKNIIIQNWKKLRQISFNNSKKIITLSRQMSEIISGESVQIKQKTKVITTWCDSKKIKPIRKNNNFFLKNQLENKFIILYSGNQGRCHDMETIISSVIKLKDFREIHFVFVGDGAKNQFLKTTKRENNLENCSFLPYQNEYDFPHIIASADLAIVSICEECNGLIAPSKFYTHLSCGTPICLISPENSYIRNIIENEKCGKWFKNNDVNGIVYWIKRIKNNPSELSLMGKNSRKFLKRNANKDIILNQYEKVFLDCV